MRALLIACLGLLSCGSPARTGLSLSDYSTRCAAAAECVAVTVGALCPCACPNAAINRSDLPRYEADRMQVRCADTGVICGPCPEPRAPVCQAGTCALPRP
jgi:hypothetical protein